MEVGGACQLGMSFAAAGAKVSLEPSLPGGLPAAAPLGDAAELYSFVSRVYVRLETRPKCELGLAQWGKTEVV